MRNLALLLLLVGVLLASCSREQPADTETLNEALFSEPASFDPRSQADAETYGVMYAMFDTLVELNNSATVVPSLATRWETADFRVWRFYLRKDVFFHTDPCFKTPEQTRVLTADDIVYSLNRALLPGGTGAFALTDILEGAQEVNDGQAESATGLRAIDSLTVELTLQKPYRNLPERLALPFLFIVPREAVEAYGDGFGRHPIGTGPFRLDAVSPGQSVSLRRHNKFWGRDSSGRPLPYLNRINFRILRDPQVAFSEFERGTIDAIELPPSLAKRVLGPDGLAPEYKKYQMLETNALDSHYFAFRMDRPPFNDNLPLRQAMNYAVDKRQIAETLLNGLATPSVGILPPSVYPDQKRAEVFPYDPVIAKRLLAQAGYPDGKGLPLITLSIDEKPVTSLVAQYVQSSLNEIGVKTVLRKTDFNTLLGEVGQGKDDFYYMFWEGTDPNAEIFMVQFKSDLLPSKGGYNFGHYSDYAVDRLFEEAVSTLDPTVATSLWLRMNEKVNFDAPAVFLYHTKRVRLIQPGIRDYDHNPMQIRRYVTTQRTGE